jgi:hypothetical protein
MTQRTPLFHYRLGGVSGMKIPHTVIGGLKIRPLGIMTFRAAEGRIYLVVTHKAVGHLRHVGVGHAIRGIDPPVARRAGVRCIKMTTNVTRVRQVCLFINGRCDYRRDISQL